MGYLCGATAVQGKEPSVFSLAFIIVIICKINLTQQNFDIFKITLTNPQSSLPPSICTLTSKFVLRCFNSSVRPTGGSSHPSLTRPEQQ